MDRDDVSKRLSAYGMGLLNTPFDLVRYSGLGANALFEAAGLRSPEDARSAAQAINQAVDNPLFLPQELTDYRNWLMQEAPENFVLGEVAGGALAGQSAALPYLLQKGAPVARYLKANPGIGAGLLAAIIEGQLEPMMDEEFNYIEHDKQ